MDRRLSRDVLVVAGIGVVVGGLLSATLVFAAFQPLTDDNGPFTERTVWISGTVGEVDAEEGTIDVALSGDADEPVEVNVSDLPATGGPFSCATVGGELRCTPSASVGAIENGTRVCAPATVPDEGAPVARQLFINASCTAGPPGPGA